MKKLRIKISLKKGASKSKKKAHKTKKSDDAEAEASEEEGNRGDDEMTQALKRKRKRSDKTDSTKKVSRKRTKKSEAASKPSTPKEPQSLNVNRDSATTHDNGDDSADMYLDVDLWRGERVALDKSFNAARAHFLERGPWKLPAAVGNSKFRQVAKQTLIKIGR